MKELKVTNRLKGDLGELYFEHYCQVSPCYAYVRLEEIWKNRDGFSRTGIIVFRLGWERISVTIPSQFHAEILRFAKPLNGSDPRNGSAAYVFDYLTLDLVRHHHNPKDSTWTLYKNCKITTGTLRWVEVKTGKSQLQKSQRNALLEEHEIPVYLFRITSEVPEHIDVEYSIPDAKTAK